MCVSCSASLKSAHPGIGTRVQKSFSAFVLAVKQANALGAM